MSVDINKVISWFDNHIGKITYSMYGSRNGNDGTGDCSGTMTQALYEAGASKPAYLYSTETIHPYLINNGFKLYSENESWVAKRGDIVVMGKRGESAGAFGHIGVISTDDPNALLLSTSFWTGGESGTAVGNVKFDEMWEADGSPYFYVYRLSSNSQSAPKVPAKSELDQILNVGEFFSTKKAYRIDEYAYVNGLEQVISYELANGGKSKEFDWSNNGWGLASFEIVDSKGNIQKDQTTAVGKYMQLHNPNRIRVAEVDEATNGIGIDTRYGRIWADATSFTEVN